MNETIKKLTKFRDDLDSLIQQMQLKIPVVEKKTILFKFPTRGRPELFKKQLDNLYSKLSNKYNYHILVTADIDDKTMNNGSVLKYLSTKPNLLINFGNSKSKIQAVNADIEMVKDWDVLVLLSDDMTIVQQNFDQIVVQAFNAQSGPLALNFNDGRRHDWRDLCTLSIMNKQYYDKFNYIYHPSYKSEWCDNEFTLVAKQANQLISIDKIIIKHEWVNLTKKDQLFIKNAKEVPKDRQNFIKRQKEGFPK